MSKKSRVVLSAPCFTMLSAMAYLLAQRGRYGWTLFILLPVIAGGLGTWSFRPATAGQAVRIGATVGAVGCGLFLLPGWEGFICMVMAFPLVVALTIVGSLLAYWAGPSNPERPAVLALLVPISMFFDANAKARSPPVSL